LLVLVFPNRIRALAGYVLTLGIGGLAIAGLCDYFQPARQIRPVAAIEIPIGSAADRVDLVELLKREAAVDGELHVDDVTDRWRSLYAASDRDGHPTPVEMRSAIEVGVWRGKRDDDHEVSVSDRGQLGRAWATFFDGKHPEKSGKARTRMLAAIKRRWPQARDIPVMPNGALPLSDDLIWTGRSYAVKPDRITAYTAKPTSR
jgi:hypothetical protein